MEYAVTALNHLALCIIMADVGVGGGWGWWRIQNAAEAVVAGLYGGSMAMESGVAGTA